MSDKIDALSLLQEELSGIEEIDIKSLRQLVLNPNYDSLIKSLEEIDVKSRYLICGNMVDKDKINRHIDAINYYIRSAIVYGIRKNPNPKSTPLSAFEFEGHNETDVKQLKNSVNVLIF